MVVTAIDGYRLWAPVYDSGVNPLLAVESRTIKRLLGTVVPVRVVDVACGTGRWMHHFGRVGATVFGIDASPEMLARAQQRRSLRGRIVLGDAQDLAFANDVADLVICSFAASYVRNLAGLMAELGRIAAPGGRVLVSDMHSLASAAGWQRSFKIDGSLYELEHFQHTPEHMRAAGQKAGLWFETESDGYFGEEELPLFERAGKQNFYSQSTTVPAVWCGLWTKP